VRVSKFGEGQRSSVVAAGVTPAVEPGILPGGGLKTSYGASFSAAVPGGKMPPSTAGETPAATISGPEHEYDGGERWVMCKQHAVPADQ